MCATAAPALLLVLLVSTLSILIMLDNKIAAEGLPISRRERGADDILAGQDFLSVFLESSMYRSKEAQNDIAHTPSVFEDTTESEPFVRTSRQVSFDDQPETTEGQSISLSTSDPTSSDGVIVAVRVSSSVDSQIGSNKVVSSSTTTEGQPQSVFASKEQPSIIARATKSEFNVDESEPVTSIRESRENYDLASVEQSLTRPVRFNISDFLNNQKSNQLPPFHHSFIYHDNPQEPGRARSVSYSTIIQAVPSGDKNTEPRDRQERHYETGTGFRNSLDKSDNSGKEIQSDIGTKLESSVHVSSTSTTTSESSVSQTTEKNWGKLYTAGQPIPKIYGRPEQNYEIDESVSVQTNGRTHGIQAKTQADKKAEDDNQKVGYVVEGRNYRKYRVEERTADGFIVGEYGVVSNDDGSLRGVRYTADGTINPRLIYDALMKFLSL